MPHSTESTRNNPHPVICLLEEQKGITEKGGTMRRSAHRLLCGLIAARAQCYGARQITERHRHRYEFNNAYRERFDAAGMCQVGLSPDGSLVKSWRSPHPWFVAVQYHPEFKSQPTRPHPLFAGFIGAAVKHRRGGAAVTE